MPRIRIAILLATVCAIGLTTAAYGGGEAGTSGETYYVRTSGSDSFDGLTSITAFRTIQHAVCMCGGSGHTIYVGPDTYNEQVLIGTGAGEPAHSGTEDEPNRIIGDYTGEHTGDEPGQIIIDGSGSLAYGIRIHNRDHWSIERITMCNQASYGVCVQLADGVTINHCTIYVPQVYAIWHFRGEGVHIEGNTFLRDDYSGSCIWVQGCSGEVRVSRNRMSLTGDRYLSTGYRHGWRGNPLVYGIIVLTQFGFDTADVRIDNNVVSDAYYGIHAITTKPGDSARISHNSVAGSLHALNGTRMLGTMAITDNIVTDSYYGVTGIAPGSPLIVSGLLTHNITAQTVLVIGNVTISGLIEDVDPLWVDPTSGNFALDPASPVIDEGVGQVVLTADIRGAPRPYDGDGDGDAHVDLGAYEFNPLFDGSIQPRIVHWREREPD